MPYSLADVVSHLKALPPFPKVAAKLLRLLDNSSVSVEELASVIASDPGLVLKVIHIANSPFYMCARRIESIRDAVLVLGINAIKGLTTAVSVQEGLSKLRPQTKEFDSTAFWKHSYATAIAVARRASVEAPAMRDKLYLVGLIHDIGKLIQAYYWPDGWAAAVSMSRAEEIPYVEAEQRIFGFGHYKIAVEVCTSWQFPEEMMSLLSQLAMGETQGIEDIGASGKMLHEAHYTVNMLNYRCPPHDFVRSIGSDGPLEQNFLEDLAEEVEYQLRVLER